MNLATPPNPTYHPRAIALNIWQQANFLIIAIRIMSLREAVGFAKASKQSPPDIDAVA